jgi:predicted SAM-dependent methyltransferase
MGFLRVQSALAKVPVLYPILKWCRDTVRSIFGPLWLRHFVKNKVARHEPVRIIIGAGGIRPEKGWIPTNLQYLNLLVDEDWRRAFGNQRLDAIFAEHVWEHLTPADAKAGAAQCYKYLAPGGNLRIAVPDGYHPDPDYIEFVRPGGPGPGAYDHKVLYTYDTLRAMLESVGFHVELLEYYDAEGNFHHSAWDPARGRVRRCQGSTERKADGSIMHYTSLIVDARK